MAGPTSTAQAFSGIFHRYREPIRRYLRSLARDSAEAEDLTQETFLRAYRNLSSLQDQAKLSPWLYRIATNVFYDRYRQTRFHPQSLALDEVSPAGEEATRADPNLPRLDQVIEQKEMSACVQDYLDNLSDSYRAVILLHDMEGLSNPEIAEMLGCSLATVKVRLHRARRRLKEALAQACDFSCDERGVLVCEPKPPATEPEPE
jgi:RNA polymerase sigma-70 factor (ECF subfamily)